MTPINKETGIKLQPNAISQATKQILIPQTCWTMEAIPEMDEIPCECPGSSCLGLTDQIPIPEMHAEIPCECPGSSCLGWTDQVPIDQITRRLSSWREEYDRLMHRLAFSASTVDIVASHAPELEKRYAKLWELIEKYDLITDLVKHTKDLEDGRQDKDRSGNVKGSKALAKRVKEAKDNMEFVRGVMKGR